MLARRSFLAGAATLTAGLTGAAPVLALPPAEQQLGGLMARLWDEQLRRFPETVSGAGAATLAASGRADPWSRAAREDWVDWARSATRRIEAVDASDLPAATLANRAVLLDHFGKVARLGTRYRFGAAAGDSFAPVAPYAISPLTGPHRALSGLLEGPRSLPGASDRDDLLAQLSALPRALDAATAAFRSDAAAGVVPPDFSLDATLAQLARLRQGGVPGVMAGADGAASRAAALLERGIAPALERQIGVLAAARAAAPVAAGVWTLRDGDQFYADALAWHTASTLAPAEIEALGRDRVAGLAAELDAVLDGLQVPQGSLAQRMAVLAQRPAPGRLDPERLAAAVADLFPVAPRHEGASDPALPPYLAAVSALRRSFAPPRWEAAAAAANPGVPAILQRGTRYGAFAEGWAGYAERALDQAGLFAPDRASRAGLLQLQLLGAARVVADVGLHLRRWTRAQAAAYLAATTGLPAAAMAAEVDRACIAPGQACAAAVGQAEWQRLHTLAQRVAGSRFDQRHFHRLILQGRAPFGVVEDLVVASFTPRLSVLGKRAV